MKLDPFWDSCRRGQLVIQRCDDCNEYQWYPRGICANCWSENIQWVQSSGHGTVWTYTVTNQNRTTGFEEMVPYVLALVELDEGVRMFTNIVDCNPADVSIGMEVEVTFRTATPPDQHPLLQTGRVTTPPPLMGEGWGEGETPHRIIRSSPAIRL